MHDTVIEKRLVWLFVLSLAAHIALFLIIQRFTSVTPAPRQEPVYIDLQDIPLSPRPPNSLSPSTGQRFSRPASPARPVLPSIGIPKPRTVTPTVPPESAVPRSEPPVASGESISSLLRRKPAEVPPSATRPNLAPDTRTLGRLEEKYRKRYEKELENIEGHFLLSKDLRLVSFSRRFKEGLYTSWSYPVAAGRQGLQGTALAELTVARNGTVVNIEILEGTGHRILDDEIIRAVKSLRPLGALPPDFTKEEYRTLIFFHYINGMAVVN